MKRRPLGSTGMQVSEIGLGAWQLANPAWGLEDQEAAIGIVHAALDEGCNFFDTAPGYGEGRSESILGHALKGRRDQVLLCSKFGHLADGSSDFRTQALRPAIEPSLQRLQTDHLDLLLVHNPPSALLDGRSCDLYAELEALRREGKIRAYGVSIDSAAEMRTVLESTGSQVLEILFNVFSQDCASAFALASTKGVGLIAKVPLDSGWLSGKYRQGSRFEGIRERWSEDVIARRAALVEELAGLLPAGLSMPEAALQFILAHSAISTVIPGAKSVEQARRNFAAAARALPPETVTALRRLWETRLRAAPLPW
jgi:aryl-alcohol dehydrogenase-like predicted oxidoreductase